MACTSPILPVSAGSTLSTYPSATATSRHAPVSRADPSAVRYRANRVPPCDPLADAIAWATQASKSNPVRFDVVTKDASGTWTTLKHILNGQVSEPPA